MTDKKTKLSDRDSAFLKELKRKVDLTRRSRIKASTRLRGNHHYYEKVTYFYSLIILVLSIWFLNQANNDFYNDLTKVLLIMSMSLTFLTMFFNIKNYKERAGSFEMNYLNLGVLLNKIERIEIYSEDFDENSAKGLHREYEKLLIEMENHLDIDYQTCNVDNQRNYAKEIRIYKIVARIKNAFVAVLPAIIFLMAIYLNQIQ